MGMRAEYLHQGQTLLRGIADRVAQQDRIEATEKKRIADAFRAGVNPYAEAAKSEPAAEADASKLTVSDNRPD